MLCSVGPEVSSALWYGHCTVHVPTIVLLQLIHDCPYAFCLQSGCRQVLASKDVLPFSSESPVVVLVLEFTLATQPPAALVLVAVWIDRFHCE